MVLQSCQTPVSCPHTFKLPTYSNCLRWFVFADAPFLLFFDCCWLIVVGLAEDPQDAQIVGYVLVAISVSCLVIQVFLMIKEQDLSCVNKVVAKVKQCIHKLETCLCKKRMRRNKKKKQSDLLKISPYTFNDSSAIAIKNLAYFKQRGGSKENSANVQEYKDQIVALTEKVNELTLLLNQGPHQPPRPSNTQSAVKVKPKQPPKKRKFQRKATLSTEDRLKQRQDQVRQQKAQRKKQQKLRLEKQQKENALKEEPKGQQREQLEQQAALQTQRDEEQRTKANNKVKEDHEKKQRKQLEQQAALQAQLDEEKRVKQQKKEEQETQLRNQEKEKEKKRAEELEKQEMARRAKQIEEAQQLKLARQQEADEQERQRKEQERQRKEQEKEDQALEELERIERLAKEIEDEKKAEMKRQMDKYHEEQKRIEDEAQEKKKWFELEKKRLLKGNVQNKLAMLNDSDVRIPTLLYRFANCIL